MVNMEEQQENQVDPASMQVENQSDERDIITDQDEALNATPAESEEQMGADGSNSPSIENQPEEFVLGEIDVKDQMDLARRRMEHPSQP